MKQNVHKLISEAAVKLLPYELRDELQKTVNGKKYIDLIKQGADEEDSTAGPLGDVDPPGGILTLDEWATDGPYPWLEHYWNHNLGNTGLINPFGTLWVFNSAWNRAERYWEPWVINKYRAGALEDAYINLGRVAHLLADVGTPAHVHSDAHPNIMGFMWDDDFEDYVGEKMKNGMVSDWDVNPHPGPHRIIYNPSWSLYEHFRNLAEISMMYDSDDVDGLGNGHPYHWDHICDSYEGIWERDITGDLTDYACEQIAKDLLPAIIEFTAGLYCMFFRYVNFEFDLHIAKIKLTKLHVIDDTDPAGEGEVYLNVDINQGVVEKQLGRFDISGGSSTSLSEEFSFEIKKDEPIVFKVSGYDDDSWWLEPDAKEAMGKIDKTYNPPNWGGGTHSDVESSGGEGKFALDYLIDISSTKIDNIASVEQVCLPLTASIKSNFDPNTPPPIALNRESLCLHGLTKKLNPHKVKIGDEHKAQFYMFPYELYKEKEGKKVIAEDKAHYCGICMKDKT